MESFSDIIIVMKVGYYGEKITSILPRIKAQYEAEKVDNPDAFYPFGYERAYTPDSVRMLLERHISSMSEKPSSIDVLFSPISKAYDAWREGCKNKTLRQKFDLGPKKGAWRYLKPHVRGLELFPERYPTGSGLSPSTSYYGLLIEDLKLFTDPTEKVGIDLKPYRMMIEEDINGWELRGRWRMKSAIPCFRVNNHAEVPKKKEPVIARAKLVYPYAVQLSATPFD